MIDGHVIKVTSAPIISSNREHINRFVNVVSHRIANQAAIVAAQMCN
jgi:hypothetical protein